MRILKKILKTAGLILLDLFLILFITISPLTKYLIEKYDVEVIGREVAIETCFVNPFTGGVRLGGLTVYEHQSDSVFFEAGYVKANFDLFKLLSQTYEISSLTIDRPSAHIIQNKSDLNFSDLIERFTPDELADKSKKPVKFNLLNFEITNGQFRYEETQIPVHFFIKDVNLTSAGLRWDNDTIAVNFSFLSGVESGSVAGNTKINLKNLNYIFELKVDTFDLDIVNQYLDDLTNYGEFAALLNAEIMTTGNFNSADSVTATGTLAFQDFHFGKNKNEDFASFQELAISAKMLNPKEFLYDFDSIILNRPFLKYEMYDALDNIQTMFGEAGSKVSAANSNPNRFNLVIEVVKVVEQLARNLLRSDYKLDRLAIYNGNFEFVDYTVGEMFIATANPFNLYADSIDKQNNRVNVEVNSGIKPYGRMNVSLSIDPKDSSYFDMNYQIQDVPITMFNPYIINYTSYPFDRGTFEVSGNWKVRAGNIDSYNHLVLLDPRVTKRIKSEDAQWIPVPLLMAFVRERGNVIDYEIPIRGSLKDPNFKIKDIVLDILKNIFVKPATTPYRMEVKKVEQRLENSMRLSWQMRDSKITSSQEKFIDVMIDFLKENPDAKISISPKNYTEKEKEHILLFEAKKEFYLSQNEKAKTKFSEKDSSRVARMSIKDEAFIKYLDEQVHNTILFTVQQKAAVLVKASDVNAKFKQLNLERKASFLELFTKEGVERQISFDASEDIVPYNGKSYFNISYDGQFPVYLQEAFEKMDEFDDENPREQYKDKRENIE